MNEDEAFYEASKWGIEVHHESDGFCNGQAHIGKIVERYVLAGAAGWQRGKGNAIESHHLMPSSSAAFNEVEKHCPKTSALSIAFTKETRLATYCFRTTPRPALKRSRVPYA